jgi:alcohol dehydrogenase class IV
MRFEFSTAARLLFGAGTTGEVGAAARGMGNRALVVAGVPRSTGSAFWAALETREVPYSILQVSSEPTLDLVEAGVARALEEKCDYVIGFGGGSALDASKAIAALMANGGNLIDYLEVIGLGKPLTRPPVPFITVPTTSGTGAEVTRNAVLTSKERQVKVSLRSPWMTPRLAVVDPEMTLDLPPALTASTGMDALTQLIEAFVSLRANPLTDGFCVEGIGRAARSLRRACSHGSDIRAREDMSLASLLGGLALANAGLGVVHGIAAPLGGMFPVPHGIVCAAILPRGMEINIRALRARSPGSEALRRYETVARILTGRSEATAEDGAIHAQELFLDLGIPSLGPCGVTQSDLPLLVQKASLASSMKGNPIALTAEEIHEVLARSL